MNYNELDKAEFDAIVTGELTHYAIWLESELVAIISNYFVSDKAKLEDFKRLLLFRDGLTFQSKIEIVRAMLNLFHDKNVAKELKTLLDKIEKFKSWRNAMAHGHDVSEDEDEFIVEDSNSVSFRKRKYYRNYSSNAYRENGRGRKFIG